MLSLQKKIFPKRFLHHHDPSFSLPHGTECLLIHPHSIVIDDETLRLCFPPINLDESAVVTLSVAVCVRGDGVKGVVHILQDGLNPRPTCEEREREREKDEMR